MSVETNGINGDHGTPPKDVYSATSVQEIRAALTELGEREAAVTARLDNLLATQKDLTRQLGRLDLARAQLGSQVVATRAISNGMLSNAASTAHRISGAVKKLDHEQANVKATLEVVEQVAELKACVLGVTGSMGAPQDWETAASYLHRASQIPDSVIDGAFAEEIVPTAEVPDPPRQTLNAAAESLCGLFLREFDKAAKAGDGSSIARFFKLFPLINRSDVGLDAYGRYVCSGIAARARANMNTAQQREGMFYANALTKLFEHIAEIVDGHEPLVERHYGAGSMVKVIQRIQVEADVQGGIILDTWSEERRVSRKLTDVKSYPFNFLAQGLLSQKPPGPTSGRGSPAPASGRPSEDDTVDTKDVDALLSESAIMLSRWSLYTRFISSKASEPELSTIDHGLTIPSFLTNSTLHKKISDHLIEPFNLLATFFFRRAVEKAFQLDESPPDLSLNPNKPLNATPPFITSAVDDVMYNAQQVMQRTLSTSQRATAASIIPAVGRVLASDFFGITQRKMQNEAFPKAAIQGALPPESTIIQFMLLMNNLDVATDYAKRIVSSCLGPQKSSLADTFPFGHDSVFVTKALNSVQHGFESKTSELLDDAVDVLLRRVIRPRLQPVLVEAFRDVDYSLTSEDEAEADADDTVAASTDGIVAQRFERGWQAFMLPIKRLLTPANYTKLLLASCSFLSERLQKRLWSYDGRVSELGAVKLERDFAGVVAAAVRGGEYGLRNVFAKVLQMTMIVGMEADEWEGIEGLSEEGEVERVSGVVWRLGAEERRRVRGILVAGR